MHLHLAELSSDLPLASGWGDAQLVQDELDLGALRVARAGLMSRRVDGMEVTGSAAACDEAPLRRAWLELVERTAIVDAAQRETPDSSSRRRAQSSGVAAAPSWDQACERACLELAERDVVLRSWYGEIRPVQAPVPPILASIPRYDWAARLLPGPRWMRGVTVAIVVGFPLSPRAPLARGFAARRAETDALVAAGREALQTLAFLWHEEPVSESPAPAPSPIFHLDYYLYPPHHLGLRRWLAGDYYDDGYHAPPRGGPGDVSFVDLTPAHLSGRLRVARAICPVAELLEFGMGPETIPEQQRVHPIP